MDTIPSFDGDTITLNIGETYTLTDTNGRLQHYPEANVTENGIRFEHASGSNDLKITATENCNVEEYTFYSRNCGLNLQYGGSTQYVYLFRDGYQKNLYTNGYGSDPTFYLDFRINLTGRLELNKTNANGDLIEGAKFHVWSNDTGYDEIVTVSGGKIVIENLKPGTYNLREERFEETGYILNTETYSVNVKPNETATKTVINDEPTGSIAVEKKNKNGDTLGAGFVFKITAAEDIYNVARTKKYYSRGDIVGRITTTSSGVATKTGLPLGRYLINEESVVSGYLLNTETKNVTLKYKDQVTEVIYESITISNDEPTRNDNSREKE